MTPPKRALSSSSEGSEAKACTPSTSKNLLPTTPDRDLSKYPTPRPVPANENGWPKNTSTAALTSAQRFPTTTCQRVHAVWPPPCPGVCGS